jgi:hypothetical protein
MQNGHTELVVALVKLVGIVPILVCQNPFYKTSSIPKLLSWHIPLLISQQCGLVVSWAY